MIAQVLLQTYIEHLRGKIEDSTTINYHGKELTIEDGKVIGVSDVGVSSTDPDPTPVVPFKDSNKALINTDEQAQREALKAYYERYYQTTGYNIENSYLQQTNQNRPEET